MIPSAAAVQSGVEAVASALGVSARVSGPALRVALAEADQLCADVYDAPAALLYVFGRHPRCFETYRAMSALVVAWHAHTLGFKLEVGLDAIADALRRVTLDELDYEGVRTWLGGHLLPYGG